jgi:hypothetical protein
VQQPGIRAGAGAPVVANTAPPSAPSRLVDAIVGAVGLGELGFDGVVPEAISRPSYHPAVLLKLYIYG